MGVIEQGLTSSNMRLLHRSDKPKIPKGAKIEMVEKADGSLHPLTVLSFRDSRHLDFLVNETVNDRLFAFHGWGVVGGGKRVDRESKYWGIHNDMKVGRPQASKVPIVEPPEYAVKHIDWDAVHPDLQYLQDPKEFAKLWKGRRPFHLIAPVKKLEDGGVLTESVVTPAFDPKKAENVPFPTACFFWEDDPALNEFVKRLKKENKEIILGVTSANDSGQNPDFYTSDFISNLTRKAEIPYKIVVEDPLVEGMADEGLSIASSHSQFVLPMDYLQDPFTGKKIETDAKFLEKRRGSLSASEFSKLTGMSVAENPQAPIASRMRFDVDLDKRLEIMAKRLDDWHKNRYVRALKQLLSIG